MSPKPVDVRRALETLRAERPTPEATERARAAVRRPSPRRSPARPLTVAMITTALAVVVLTPRTHAGAAWAQTLANTLNAPASHSVDHWSSGKVAMEEWRSGVKRATVLYTDDGRVQTEMRNDGKLAVNYFNWNKVAEFHHEKPAPNALSFAIVSNDEPSGHGWAEKPVGSPKAMLSDPDIKVVAHQEASGDRPETYRLEQTYRLGGKPIGKSHAFTAEIDPASGRIRALIQDPRKFKGRMETFRTEIDYPASIPASVFAPRVQVAKVAVTYDLVAQDKAVQRTLREGMGRRGPVVLRSVFLDGEGALWVYWTGALDTRTLTLRGVPREGGAQRNAYPSGLTGLRLVPSAKLGSAVDLDIPYPGGVARFHSVPIWRIGFISHVQDVLMAFRPAR